MSKSKKYTNFMVEDINKIEDYIIQVSEDMHEYIKKNNESNYTMFYKTLTHSDLPSFGKATKKNDYEKNLLYYMTTSEMISLNKTMGTKFQTAKQSNIGLMKELYDKVELKQPRENERYIINDTYSVFLVNDTLGFFESKYTKEVFEKLGKKQRWCFNNLDVKKSEGKMTDIQLSVARHGIGTSEDEEFHKLRHHMFKGDSIILLFERKGKKKNLFILLDKNPVFYSILGASNKKYEEYLKKTKSLMIEKLKKKDNAVSDQQIEDEVTRQKQEAWRKMLANEMMSYTQTEDEVFCPFTYITADYTDLGSIFVASHIKGFNDPKTTNDEKYDINNGLLLCANADVLFDRHLITVSEDKELLFSFLLDNNSQLKQKLLLMQPIFTPLLNEKRMKYLEFHRNRFFEKERERKQSN